MAEKKKLTAKNVQFREEGETIIVPENMSPKEILAWAKMNYDRQEEEVGLRAEVDCSPLDGLVALHKAISQEFGWSSMIPTPGFWGDTPPTMITVPTGAHGESIQAGYGRIIFPQIDKGYIQTQVRTSPRPGFIVAGSVKRKHERVINRILDAMRVILKNESIYKGRAIRLSYDWQTAEEGYDPIQHAPKFWDVTERPTLIFPEEVETALQIGLWSFIEFTDIFRRERIPIRRGVLLAGPYGVGKTLSARETARRCEENGWTFIHLDDVRHLADALQFAAEYAPAVLFAEDVDQVVGGNRDTQLNDILNRLDGVDTKDKEIITVLTTNRLDAIHPSALRPGRIDSLVEMRAPDREAATKLIKAYGGKMLAPTESFERAGQALDGKIPAVIRAVVENSKAAAITRIMRDGGDAEVVLSGGQVTEIDVIKSAKAIEMHDALINKQVDEEKTPAEYLADAMAKGILSAQGRALLHVGSYLEAWQDGDSFQPTPGAIKHLESVIEDALSTK